MIPSSAAPSVANRLDRLRSLIAPPVFAGDDDKTRMAYRLHVTAIVGILIALFYALGWLLAMPGFPERLLFALATILNCALVIGLLRAGRVQTATHVLMGNAWIITTAMAAVSGGTQSPLFGFYIVVMIGSILFSTWSVTVLYGSLILIASLVMVYLRSVGVLPGPVSTPLSAWLSQIAIISFVSLECYLIVGDIRQSLAQTRQTLVERQATEAALRESEKRYRMVSELMSDYAYAYDIQPDGTLLPVWITDESFERLTGRPWRETGGTMKLYHPDDAETARRDVTETVAGRPTAGEYRIVTASGETRWVHILRRLELSEDERPIRLYGSARDITEAKRLEAELKSYTAQLEQLVDERTQALRHAKDRLELILDNTANALAFADSRGDVVVSNPAFRTTFEEASQHIEYALRSIAGEDQITAVSRAMIRAICNGERHHLETRVVSAEGVERDIELTLIPLQVVGDVPRNGMLLSGHDITELKQIERFKERFVADVVHDLATPIQGLNTRLYLLKRSPEQLADHVRALDNQIKHLRSLLDDLRMLSQLDRGQTSLAPEPCDVAELMQRVFDIYEPLATDKGQSISLCLPPGLPILSLDTRQIERALVNLVANAINYTASGKSIEMQAALEDGALIMRVADQGMGIRPEDLPHIFERFYRSADARRALVNGTGLGLAIAQEIVAMHGGSVHVSSAPGQGSVFTIRLPAHA